MGKPIYLDYAATTPLRPQVRAAIEPYLTDVFGNPSSLHAHGRWARVALEEARDRILATLGVGDGRIVFTGSGSESDNLAILGFARRHPGGCVIRSSIEHKAVVEATRALEADGYDVRVAPVDGRGVLDLEALANQLPTDPIPTLVSIMWANNETGVIEPVRALADICHERDLTFHSDAVQAFGKIPLDLKHVPIDMLSLSAHKIGGPKGVGALYIGPDIDLEPVIYGGGQEGGMRSGTENVAAIVGFAEAAEAAREELEAESTRLRDLRERLEAGLTTQLPEIVVNGGDAPERLPNILNVSVPDVDIEGLLTSLDLEGICVSSGSACTTGSVKPSNVMVAMGRVGELAQNTIRFSLGWGTESDQVEYVVETFHRVVGRVRQFASAT